MEAWLPRGSREASKGSDASGGGLGGLLTELLGGLLSGLLGGLLAGLAMGLFWPLKGRVELRA